jgi:hypothetical protein
MLSIALCVAMLATNAMALPQPKVSILYSLETADGGGYYQEVTGTLFGLGNVDFVFDVASPGNSKVTVLVASPLEVIIEFTADAPGGNIIDGPVELVYAYFDREWEVVDGFNITTVHNDILVWLSRKGTGTLSGSTITWDNTVAPYQESAIGGATCTRGSCGFTFRDLSVTNNDVTLPDFTVLANPVFGDSFISDNGTPGDGTLGTPSPGDRADDIDRTLDPSEAVVIDTWLGVELPEPSREILLLAGALALVGLGRLRERGDRRRALREPPPIGSRLGDRAGSRRR